MEGTGQQNKTERKRPKRVMAAVSYRQRYLFKPSPFPCLPNQATSKRSWFITLVHTAAKSFTNFSLESAHA